jgi:hypothetical protein
MRSVNVFSTVWQLSLYYYCLFFILRLLIKFLNYSPKLLEPLLLVPSLFDCLFPNYFRVMQRILPLYSHSLFGSTKVLAAIHLIVVLELRLHKFPPKTPRILILQFLHEISKLIVDARLVAFGDTIEIKSYDCNLSHLNFISHAVPTLTRAE